MDFTLTNWLLFLAFIGLCLALDLGLLSKNNAKPSFKTAGLMTLVWLAIALAFSALLFVYQSSSTALDFLTGYIMELSLSMDNIFVFILIFRYFKVPIHLQHRVLFWGVIGAVAMRFIMIISGVYLIKKFEWLFYVFGAILIYSAYKMITHHTPTDGMQNTEMINWLKKHLRITEDFDGDRFITTYNGKIYLTPLSLVLFLIEQADLVFAIDSIPAILAITQDSFVVFSSNIFAILGLRSLYFVLLKIIDKFTYLHYGLSVILAFIGVKMILSPIGIHISTAYSLALIFVSIASTIAISLLTTKK